MLNSPSSISVQFACMLVLFAFVHNNLIDGRTLDDTSLSERESDLLSYLKDQESDEKYERALKAVLAFDEDNLQGNERDMNEFLSKRSLVGDSPLSEFESDEEMLSRQARKLSSSTPKTHHKHSPKHHNDHTAPTHHRHHTGQTHQRHHTKQSHHK